MHHSVILLGVTHVLDDGYHLQGKSERLRFRLLSFARLNILQECCPLTLMSTVELESCLNEMKH
jgi:hypothetical protein